MVAEAEEQHEQGTRGSARMLVFGGWRVKTLKAFELLLRWD